MLGELLKDDILDDELVIEIEPPEEAEYVWSRVTLNEMGVMQAPISDVEYENNKAFYDNDCITVTPKNSDTIKIEETGVYIFNFETEELETFTQEQVERMNEYLLYRDLAIDAIIAERMIATVPKEIKPFAIKFEANKKALKEKKLGKENE